MIPKLSSAELNKIFDESKNDLMKFSKKLEVSKKDIENKLNVMNYEAQYASKVMNDILNGAYVIDEYKVPMSNMVDGKFSSYGNVIYPKLIKEPVNVFNLNMSGIGEHFFREDVKVLIEDVERTSYLDFLKHDTISKEIMFDLYKKDTLKMTIQVNDITNLLGPTRFNMIEIDPYLAGSFDIEKLVIYSFNSDGEIGEEAEEVKFKTCSKTRLLLNKKYNFYRIDIHFKLKYQTYKNDSIVYPFGLKHIYLLDADFTKDSYVVVPIKSDSYISIIKNDIVIQTPAGLRYSQIDLEDIEIYIDYNKGELTSRVEQSYPDERKEIARNVKTLYAKVPLKTTESLIAIKFDVEQKLY